MPFHRDVWWLFGSVAAAIAAAPLIVHGDAQTTARRTAAAQKIEEMSPAERQELEVNFKRFEKLPAADQAKYREMHARLQANPAVTEAMETFSHWWGNVTAREQAEVFKQPEVQKRIAAVGQIQEEIDNNRGGRMFFGRGWGRDGFRIPPLPRDSFFEVMQTLEAMASESYKIQKELPEIQKIDAKSPQRYQKLVIALHEKKANWSTIVPNLSEENRVVTSISNEQVREQFRKRMDDRWFGQRGFWARMQLAATLGRELYVEALKQKVGEDELQKKLASLSDDEKAELYSLPGDDSRSHLNTRIRTEAWQDTQAVLEFFQIGGFGRGPGPSGRGEPGRGEGREGSGRDGSGRDGPPGRGDGPSRGGEGPPPERRM